MKQPSLFDQPEAPAPPPDQAARDFAVDPAHHVVLEASAGTGKTRVLVDRYVRLIQAGVDPRHILAMTFTRKAAAEMRERVLSELRQRVERGEVTPAVVRTLRDRMADIQISTIDAFCFSLLREFPLEADVDPAFEIADETEMARFANEALELAFRAIRGFLADDEHVRLLMTRVKAPVLRDALATLVDRRHVALPAVREYVRRHRGPTTAAEAAAAFVMRLRRRLEASPGRAALLDDGPHAAPEFRWLHADLTGLDAYARGDPARVQQLRRRLERYFLTKDRKPRQRLAATFKVHVFASADAKKRHERALGELSAGIAEDLDALDAGINGLLARGLLHVLVVATEMYDRLLEEHALLDFAGMLERAVALLEQQEEFARSRLKLQSRYHHVLVDEFQDTSRLQWRLVELLVDAWGEGEGAADAPTSIFVVGDRKQSIYRFRHAEVTLLDEAARKIGALRPHRQVRQAISHSFRAVPELLAFVNALATGMTGDPALEERFRYESTDAFPVPEVQPGARRDGEPVLGLVAQPTMEGCASAVAAEIARLLASGTVRDRTGTRPGRPDDIAILFRARAGHQYFEEALEARDIRTYVYKGLGFFDAPEVQDLQALLRYLARPESDLRAAEVLRSRVIRLSDAALATLAPGLAAALGDPAFEPDAVALDEIDRRLLARGRESVRRWLALADRLPPSELLDVILRDAAYAFEMRGRRLDQARENVKKVRLLVRRVESRGYATLGRLASYFETLRAGDESNAIIGAAGCVNLMTIHAAKGLEFPIVFVVNLHVPGRGRASGFSVIDRSVDGEPEVAFHVTPGTKLEDQREAEELRRLLYVGVTRARDRLYLAAELDSKGRLKRGGRSLAALLPAGLAETFAAAGTLPGDEDAVTWGTPGGTFDLRVVRPASDGVTSAADRDREAEPGEVDLTPIVTTGRRVVTATEIAPVGAAKGGRRHRRIQAGPHDRLLGTLVHRLFQRGLDPGFDAAAIGRIVPGLLADVDLIDVVDPAELTAAAATAYLALRRQPEVAAALASGDVHYEVPFSCVDPEAPDRLLRGVVDCLVIRPDGGVTVLEFKTGGPRPEHDLQVRAYREAMSLAFGRRDVDVKILYA